MDPGKEGYQYKSDVDSIGSPLPGENVPKTRKMFPGNKNELNDSMQF